MAAHVESVREARTPARRGEEGLQAALMHAITQAVVQTVGKKYPDLVGRRHPDRVLAVVFDEPVEGWFKRATASIAQQLMRPTSL